MKLKKKEDQSVDILFLLRMGNKWMDLGGYHPEWGNPITKEHTWYSLIDKWILTQNLRMPKIHMKLKNEDQSVDILFLLRMGNKITMEGVTETKFRAETEKRTQDCSIRGSIPPNPDTIVYASKILLTGPWYNYLLWGYASAWQIQKSMLIIIYQLEHRAPNEEARESTQGAKGVCNPIGG